MRVFEKPTASDVQSAAVGYAVGLLRQAGETQTSFLVGQVLDHIRATFDGDAPPLPSRRQLTEAAIYGAIGRVFVETVRRTSDGRKPGDGYRAYLSLASAEGTT